MAPGGLLPRSGFNPVHHGFDSYFGVPYSNDMEPFPLYRNEELLEPDVPDQGALTGLYTKEAVDFIESRRGTLLPLLRPHLPPPAPLRFGRVRGRSAGGLYGDVVQEIDWSVGRILEALERNGLAEDTLVFFTSDNGPWYQGSPGPFRGRKGQAFEGGHRVPFVARAPRISRPASCATPPPSTWTSSPPASRRPGWPSRPTGSSTDGTSPLF